jgi:prepilin-type N-terminal cleavage/methylation domain-containing protein
MNFRKLWRRGFTLIELLVVISIISLLSSVVLGALNTARTKARDARRKSDLRQIQLALELYYDANGVYPLSGGAITPGAWSNSADASWTTLQTALSPYIKSLPKDPLENNNTAEWAQSGYHYSYFAIAYQGCPAGKFYWFVYHLENASGPDIPVAMCDGTPSSAYGSGEGANSAVKTAVVISR